AGSGRGPGLVLSRRRHLQRSALRAAGALPGRAGLRRSGRGHGGPLAPGGTQRPHPRRRRADHRRSRSRRRGGGAGRRRSVGGSADPARSRPGRASHGGRRGTHGYRRRGAHPRGAQLRDSRGPEAMSRLVQKYGGSSVATPARLRKVARRVRDSLRDGAQMVVVVSAMGDTTDELIALAHQVSNDPPLREMDMLLSTGEIIAAPLLPMALDAAGTPAVSLTGVQAGIRTSGAHRTGRIVDIVPKRVLEELEQGRVVVVAGFQGATEQMDVTTLGRGGSDTTAVALAVALGADRCEIFSDV